MIYYLGIFVFTVLSKCAMIRFGRSVKNVFDLVTYSFVTGIIASLFFLVTAKFSIDLNSTTVIYSVSFAAVVIASHFSSLLLFRFMDVSSATVLSSTLTLIITFVTGTVFLREAVNVANIFRCLIMIVASFLLQYPSNKDAAVKKHYDIRGIITVIVSSSIAVIATVISNSFAADTRVTDSDSFFFLTNVFIAGFSLAAMLIIKRGRIKKIFLEFNYFSRSGYLAITISTISSNVCSLLQILIFASGDGISLYAPISGAISLIAAGIAAVIVKEKPKTVPLVLACISLFIGLI